MWLTNLVLFVTLLISIGALSLIYGDAKGDRLVDKLSGFIRYDMGRGTKLVLIRFFGKTRAAKIVNGFNDSLEYLFLKPNPLIVYLYIFLSTGGYVIFVLYGYPELPNPVLPFPYHQHAGFALFFTTFYFFSKACSEDPGIVSKENHSTHMKLFKPDGILFPTKPLVCGTCKFDKPARSKHCAMCNVCVGRFDHHCVWINQCVGIGNVRSFLLFILFNNILCLYGSYLGCGIIQHIVQEKGLLNALFRDRITGETHKASIYYVFVYLIGHYKQLVFLTLFCTFIGVFLLWFTWYHWVSLMRAGITTNEDVKMDRMHRINKLDNAFNTGSWLRNLISVFSTSIPVQNR